MRICIYVHFIYFTLIWETNEANTVLLPQPFLLSLCINYPLTSSSLSLSSLSPTFLLCILFYYSSFPNFSFLAFLLFKPIFSAPFFRVVKDEESTRRRLLLYSFNFFLSFLFYFIYILFFYLYSFIISFSSFYVFFSYFLFLERFLMSVIKGIYSFSSSIFLFFKV